MNNTIVRSPDRMVFPINPTTLEPLQCSYYDAYCYTDPKPGVEYMEYSDWVDKYYEKSVCPLPQRNTHK